MELLRPAILYKDELNRKRLEATFDPANVYWYFSVYRSFEADIAMDEWSKWQYVSLNKEGEVRGFLSCHIDRETNFAWSLSLINFTNDAVGFGIDVRDFIDRILTQFNKLKWCVCVGNPIEPTYDRLCLRYGGRIIGTALMDQKLLDGKVYDVKHYELFREPYLAKRGIL